jgi:hypothetical protein
MARGTFAAIPIGGKPACQSRKLMIEPNPPGIGPIELHHGEMRFESDELSQRSLVSAHEYDAMAEDFEKPCRYKCIGCSFISPNFRFGSRSS